MSAECRVEAPPLSAADIAIDGLRLRLDIRIVPRARGQAARDDVNAMFRVVTAKLTRATQRPAYQWAALMVGLGTLLVAITVWIAGSGEAPSPAERSAATAPVVHAAPSAPATKAEAPARADAVPAAAVTSDPSVTSAAAPPAPIETRASPTAPPPSRSVRVRRVDASPAPKPPERPERATPAATRAAVAAPPTPSVADAIRQPVAQRPAARDDMLDLFGDTK